MPTQDELLAAVSAAKSALAEVTVVTNDLEFSLSAASRERSQAADALRAAQKALFESL